MTDSDPEFLGGDMESDEDQPEDNSRRVQFQSLDSEVLQNEEGLNQAGEQNEEDDEELKRRLTTYTIWRPDMRRLMSTHSSNNDVVDNEENEESAKPKGKLERQFTELNSEHIGGRLEAYESVGVVAALLAGFAFGGLTAVDEPELATSSTFIIVGFAATTSLTIALNFYAVVAATWIYYWGRLLLGHGATLPADLFLSHESVRQYRSSAVIALMASIPIFCLSMCFLCFVKLSENVAVVTSAFFLFVALACLDMSRTLTRAFHVSKYMFEENCSVEEATEFLQQHDEWYFRWYDRIKGWVWNRYGLFIYCVFVFAFIASPYHLKNSNALCEAD